MVTYFFDPDSVPNVRGYIGVPYDLLGNSLLAIRFLKWIIMPPLRGYLLF
jgi:hypothetical protein